jgi:hypothetical protein
MRDPWESLLKAGCAESGTLLVGYELLQEKLSIEERGTEARLIEKSRKL